MQSGTVTVTRDPDHFWYKVSGYGISKLYILYVDLAQMYTAAVRMQLKRISFDHLRSNFTSPMYVAFICAKL